MTRVRSAWVGALLCFVVGCADDPADAVRVNGDVVSVIGKPATASVDPETRFAALRSWLRSSWAGNALAQSSCSADVEGVLACLATQGAGGSFAAACNRVRSNCEFEVELTLAGDGDQLVLFFCGDTNGDGVCDPEEPAAPYLDFGKVGSFCNGDVMTVSNVGVDFGSRTCSGSPATVVADGCGAPAPTSAPAQPTTTPRPGATQRPGEPSPAPTLAPGETPLPTQTSAPLPTGTPSPRPTFAPTPSGTPCVAPLLPCNQEGLECCLASNSCIEGNCRSSGGECIETGASGCGPFTPCCSDVSCVDGVCGGSSCSELGQGCDFDAECCSGSCDGACCNGEGAPCQNVEDCCAFFFCDDSTFTCQPSV